ncbi:tetratricopeptide repeat protein [Negadavirga shengliensis]|uniref:Tetratricopeptide repeat protein n=1 Tax=Negadavirga shengliensis TaxID=1389218 RepID=A0ABV9SY79_9BACT
MKIKISIIGCLSFLMVGLAQAQGNWNWPSDPQMEHKARESNAAYNDYKKSNEFLKAKGPLHWLLTNVPDLNEALYINGVDVYAGAAKMVSDEKEARVYQDSVLTIYDLRKDLYDNEDKWIANKAYYAYQFYKGDKDKIGLVTELFERTLELNGSLHHQLIAAYFDAIYRNFAFNQAYTPDEVIEKYEDLMGRLEEAEEEGANVATPKATLEQLLTAMEIIDCNFIERNMGPKLAKDPTNMKLAQQIFQYSVQHKCTNSPTFLSALEVIDNNDPTFSTSQVRGLRYMQNSEYDKAGELFEKALTLATTDEQRAEIHWDMAKVHANLGRKNQARSSALKSAELDNTREKDAYSFIGGLIMGSSSECKGGQSRVKDYSIFIAAYDAYAKAGDTKGMSNAKSRFPSKEELFTEGFQVGETINTGCWVGQTVTLATRD